jgi:CRP/FNR family transcriptional regulator
MRVAQYFIDLDQGFRYSNQMPKKSIHSKPSPTQCANCALQPLCITLGLNDTDWGHLETLITNSKTLHKGQTLFNAGEHYTGIYIVRSGSFKLIETTQLGEERIMMFHFPGELFGFDAINQQHHYNCIALETSSVCQLSLEKLFELAIDLKPLQRQLFSLMSREVSYVPLINMNATAEQRVIKFLLSLSERSKRRGLSANHVHLSMSREELGEYLGLAPETITRILKKLHDKQLLRVELRNIELDNIEQLMAIEQGL